MFVLPGKPSDTLDWQIDPKDDPILWRFDLGLEDPFFPIDDEMHFEGIALSLTKFTKEIWPLYQEKTLGAVLYRGSSDFHSMFSWTEKQRENWDLWKIDRQGFQETHLQRLFCADAFVHYFQMLAHRLPDEMPLYLFFDVPNVGSLAERHQLLSKERFEHFQVATKGLPFTNGLLWEGERMVSPKEKERQAICLPEESRCPDKVLKRLAILMQQMEKQSFRLISESFLTEDWEGVDVLHVLQGTLSVQGERKIKGFLAAGGTVIDHD
jgi:hypothetical protein